MGGQMITEVIKAKIRSEEKFVLMYLADGADDADRQIFGHIPNVECITRWCGLPAPRAAAIIDAFKAHGIVVSEDWGWCIDLRHAEEMYPPVAD